MEDANERHICRHWLPGLTGYAFNRCAKVNLTKSSELLGNIFSLAYRLSMRGRAFYWLPVFYTAENAQGMKRLHTLF